VLITEEPNLIVKCRATIKSPFPSDFQEYLRVSSFRHRAYYNESNQAQTSIYQASYYTCI